MGATLAEEYASALDLIIGEYQDLSEIEPNHTELKYICDVANDKWSSPAFKFKKEHWDGFVERFAKPPRNTRIHALCNYWTALRDARVASYRDVVHQSYQSLQRLNPNHELLAFVDLQELQHLTDSNWNTVFSKAIKHFWPSQAKNTIDAVAHYVSALRDAAASKS